MMDLYKITREELDRKLELHKLWLNGEEGGERLDLSNHDLRGFDLYEADLRGANLSGAILIGAILSRANLYEADLRGAILRNARLFDANLSDANLYEADLRGANLRYTNLNGVNLYKVNLRSINRSFTSLYLSCRSLGAKNDTIFVNQLLVHVVDAIKSLEEEERKEYEEVLNINLPFAQRFRSDDESLDELLERKKD